MLAESVSVIYQVLNAASDGVFKLKKMFNGEIIFHFKKETEKIVLLQMKGLIQIIAKFRTEKISLHVSHHPQNILLRGMKYCAPSVAILSKVTNCKLMVP